MELKNEKNDRPTRRTWLALGGLALLVIGLNLLYIPECDEFYFPVWRFASFKDWLLSRPVQDKSYIIGVMHNGRILGNLLGIAQSKLLFSSFGWVRGLLFGLGILGLIGLMTRAAGRGKLALPLAAILILCAPMGFYTNVYSWGVAYINYVMPVLCFLTSFCLLRRKGEAGRLRIAGLFLLSFCAQLFNETFSMAMCVYAVLLLTDRAFPLRLRAAAALGFLLGAVCMAVNPEYQVVAAGGAIYSVTLDALKYCQTISGVIRSSFFVNYHLLILLSLAFALRLWKAGGPGRRVLAAADLLLAGAATAEYFINDAHPEMRKFWAIAAAGALVLAWFLSCLFLPDRRRGRDAATFLLLAAVTILPLGVLDQKVSERTFFACYILEGLTLIRLLPDRLKGEKPLRAGALVLCALCLCFLTCVYGRNYTVDRQRLAWARDQLEQGAEELVLPLVPYRDYVTNERWKKRDLSFILYREEPFDTPLRCLFYDEWVAQYGEETLKRFD